MTRRSMPPTTAPGIEPKPPSTAAVKPLMAISPILVERNVTGAKSTPPIAPTTAASTHAPEYTRSTLMPMSRAAFWFWATARMARPKRVARNSITRASIRTREAPMIPSDTGAILTGPKLTGRFEKSEGNGSSSLVHTIPAPARSMREGGPGHARAPSAPAGPRGPVLASLATGTCAHGRNTALARARLSRQLRAWDNAFLTQLSSLRSEKSNESLSLGEGEGRVRVALSREWSSVVPPPPPYPALSPDGGEGCRTGLAPPPDGVL